MKKSGKSEVVSPAKTLADLRGILPYHGPPLSCDEIVELVKRARDERAAEIVARMQRQRRR